MDLSEFIQPNMSLETMLVVGEAQTAATVGSGSLRVLATPIMIAFMERTCHQLLIDHLPQGFSSVGIHVDVRHLAPTPVGSRVQVTCRVMAIEGLKVVFEVSAQDELEVCGAGRHERMVIDAERFLRRVEKKAQARGG